MEEDDDDAESVAFVIAFIICVELSKEMEYQCEYCGKVYKQEGRYITHMKGCIDWDTPGVAVPTAAAAAAPTAAPTAAPVLDNTMVMELIRQNGEMLELLRKQQETIQMLVAGRHS
jgi:hypothetical protein